MSCDCTDRSGKPKNLYSSEVEASQQKQYIKKDRGIDVDVYSCLRVRFGWHLTYKTESNFPSRTSFRYALKQAEGNNTIGQILKSKGLR